MDTIRPLPKALERLGPLAADLRLTGSKTLAQVWRRLDPEAWDRTNNPYVVLLHAHQDRLSEAAADPALIAELDRWFGRQDAFLGDNGWYGRLPHHETLSGIAYFSMEFGLSEALPIYSGGLGILAGDHLKSASDLAVPVIGIGLLYQQGYFRQVLASDGWQLEAFPYNDPGSLPVSPVLDADGRWPRIRLELPGRVLLLRVWQAVVGRVRLYLLDSNHPLNSPWDRGITANLYSAGRENRLLQELVLGVGGWRLLSKLGLDAQVCHLNEGHAAFAVIARAATFAENNGVSFPVALRATRAGNVFTTHTPVEAAFDRFEPELVLHYAGPLIGEAGLAANDFLALGRRDPGDASEPFNMAYLALRGSGHVNGVARLHGEVSRRLFGGLFPGWPVDNVPVGHVTNGVHVPTWHSDAANGLWTAAHGADKPWLGDIPLAAQRIAGLSDERLWDYRASARKSLVDYVRERLVHQLRQRNVRDEDLSGASRALDANVLTLGFARRFAAYKRADLMLRDPDRFAQLLNDPARPVQIIVAGKAHPDDQGAKEVVRELAQFAWRPDVRSRVIFLEDYDMVLAEHLAAGVDVWLNNPRRPAEACGTSGMKILVNGGLHCSTLDGWWDEAYEPEVGWAIGGRVDHDGWADGADAEALYSVLERDVVPEFYDRDEDGLPRSWIARVRASMSRLTPQYSSDRMVRDYVEGSYLPAARAFAERSADGGQVAAELEMWATRVVEGWPTIRFGRLDVISDDHAWVLEVQVLLGEVEFDSVRIEAYADGAGGPLAYPMDQVKDMPGAVNGHIFRAVVPGDRPADHYSTRAVPWHPAAFVPLESASITWGPRAMPPDDGGIVIAATREDVLALREVVAATPD